MGFNAFANRPYKRLATLYATYASMNAFLGCAPAGESFQKDAEEYKIKSDFWNCLDERYSGLTGFYDRNFTYEGMVYLQYAAHEEVLISEFILVLDELIDGFRQLYPDLFSEAGKKFGTPPTRKALEHLIGL